MKMDDKRLKICLLVANVFPIPATKGGAIETLVNNIIDENEEKNQIDIVCISIYEEESHEISKKYKHTKFIHIKDCECNGEADLLFKNKDEQFTKYMDKVYEEIKDMDFDYIIREGGPLEEYRHLFDKLPKSKCISHIHGSYAANKVLEECFSKFITVSDYVSKLFVSNNIVDESRVKTLDNGIKIENFDKTISEEEKQELRAKYGIKENEQIVVFCGRTIKQKGIKELIQAMKKIKNIDNTKLVVIGNSNYAKQVKTDYDMELIEEAKGYEDKIIFTGFIPNDELYKIYNIATVAVFPTINEEAFGLVIIEAMASGAPVIATSSGAFPDIAKNTKTVLVDKGENLVENLSQSIDYVLDNPELRREMSIEGKLRAKEFSNEFYYDKFVKILQEIQMEDNNILKG